MERYMGLDVGTKTVGVALSDPMFMIASAHKTIKRSNVDKDLEEIAKIVDEYNVSKIIVGMPYNMNKTLGPQAQRVMSFVDLLKKKLDKEVIYVDERMTTISANRVLMENKVRRENRKEHIDKIAATYILQSYLDGK
ncbi:MAG: Holliday junction resolvase RuvX [Tissierellia bacterium]|nr:Holliday junction resolvase RuvX [Tissierellia bacterium]